MEFTDSVDELPEDRSRWCFLVFFLDFSGFEEAAFVAMTVVIWLGGSLMVNTVDSK